MHAVDSMCHWHADMLWVIEEYQYVSVKTVHLIDLKSMSNTGHDCVGLQQEVISNSDPDGMKMLPSLRQSAAKPATSLGLSRCV